MPKRSFESAPSMRKGAQLLQNTKTILDGEVVIQLPVDKIKPNPFNDGVPIEDIDSLAESIKRSGLEHPLLVYDLKDGTYELVSGHRRLAAAKQLGWTRISCIKRPYPDDERKRFIEHADANTKTRSKNARYWIAEVGHADRLLREENPDISETDINARIVDMLGISQAQLYRVRGLAKMNPDMLALERYGLSMITLYRAVKLTDAQQEELAARVRKVMENDPEADMTPSLFGDLLDEVRGGASRKEENGKADKAEKPRKAYGTKLTEMEGQFLIKLRGAKKDEDKAAAREVISDLRAKLDEVEREIGLS